VRATATRTPCLANTECTCALSPDRIATSLQRCRTASRSPRTAGGAIHACGSRPIRSRSAKSAASRSSFLTRRYANPLTPNGCAKCTTAPAATNTSAQYHPYVASRTTSGLSPQQATCPAT
jgi:hypothetical protein